jgi:DNA repair exonuclease SbcCD nuclease subunit
VIDLKIAIVSDTHLGYSRFEEDAFNQANKAFTMAASMADAILIPGDVFDFRFPKPEIIAQAIKIMRPLIEKDWDTKIESFNGSTPIYTNLPILAIPGTHERTAVGKENPLNLLSLAGIVADISEGTVILNKNGEKVAIYGLGGISEDRIKEKLKELDPKPVPDMFNIFVFHQSVYEFLPFSSDFLKLDDLPNGFDLYIDGHIHNRIESTAHGKQFLIPGSTVLTQLKESEQESKGFILYDTQSKTYEFIKIDSRPFIMKTIKFTEADSNSIYTKCEHTLVNLIEKYMDNKNSDSYLKPIIRIVLEGTIEIGTTTSNLNVRSLAIRYKDDAIIDIDSKLESKELQSSINNIREGKLDNMSIRDAGTEMLKEALNKLNFDKNINVNELFEMLDTSISKTTKKQEVTESVIKLFDQDETNIDTKNFETEKANLEVDSNKNKLNIDENSDIVNSEKEDNNDDAEEDKSSKKYRGQIHL